MIVCLLFILAFGDAGQYIQESDQFLSDEGRWRGTHIITNVTVIPMTDDTPLSYENRDVWINNGKIIMIASHKPSLIERLRMVRDIQITDGSNRYLIPGLIDSHTHVWMGDGRYPYFDHYDLWTLYLSNGITTILEMIGADPNNNIRYFLFDWRDEVANGHTIGPTFFVASPRFRDEYQGNATQIDRAVELYKNVGFDAIKVHAPNRLNNYLRLFEKADEFGIKPMGHPPYRSPDVPLETVVQLQDMICHTQLIIWQAYGLGNTFISESQMDGVADLIASHNNWIQPTNFTNAIFYLHKVDALWNVRSTSSWLKYFPQPLVNVWVNQNDIRSNPNYTESGQQRYWNALIQQTKKFHERGIVMLAGSDAGGVHLTPHGFMMAEELLSFQNDIGLSPWETLRTATINNARWLGIDDLVGTIEIGKRADLVLLNANPLLDVGAVSDVESVFVRGLKIERTQFDDALANLANRIAQAKRDDAPMAEIERHCDHQAEQHGWHAD